MNKKLLSAVALLAALTLPALAADSVTVVSWGGAYQDSVRKAFFEPFMKETGDKIVEEEFNGEIAKIRAMVESNNVTWDVVENDSMTTMAACAEGIVEKIDWDKLGLKRDEFISADASECVVPSILYATVLAYDTTKVKEPPTSITAFFDLEKYPGKRGLQKRPFVNLEWALIADGVDVKDVYDCAGDARRRGSRFRQTRHDQEGCRLVGGRRAAAATARRWPGDPDLRLERPHLQGRQGGQEALCRAVGPSGPRLAGLERRQGRQEPRCRLQVHRLRRPPRPAGRPDQLHLLWSRQQGGHRQYQSGHRARSADQPGQHEDRVYHQCVVLGRQPRYDCVSASMFGWRSRRKTGGGVTPRSFP